MQNLYPYSQAGAANARTEDDADPAETQEWLDALAWE
jgi:hypothetical protein